MQQLARGKASLKLIEALQLVASPAWAQWGPALISSVQVNLETELHLATPVLTPSAPAANAKRLSTAALAATPAPPAKRAKQALVAIAPASPAPQYVPALSRTAAQPTPPAASTSPAAPGLAALAHAGLVHLLPATLASARLAPVGPVVRSHAAAARATPSSASPTIHAHALVPTPPVGYGPPAAAPARPASPAPPPPATHATPAARAASAALPAPAPHNPPAAPRSASRGPALQIPPNAARPVLVAPNVSVAAPPAAPRPSPAASSAAPRPIPAASPAAAVPNPASAPPTVAPVTRNPLPIIRAGYFPPIATGWGTLHWHEIRWHVQPFFEVQKLVAGVALTGDQWYPVSFEVPVCVSQLDPNSRVVLLTTHLNGAFLSRYQIDGRPCHARIETRSIEYVAIPGGQRRVNPRFKDFLDLSPDQSHPMDVTDVLDPNAPNQFLRVQALPMPGWPFVVAVAVVRKLSVDEVLTGLAKTRVSVADRIAELRKEATDPSHDLLLSSVTVSLRDPLTMTRITVPGRCRAAPHYDCFDAATLLSVNQEVPTWSCPACTARLAAVANRTIADVPGVPDTLRAHLDGVNLDLLVARNVLDSIVLDDHFAEMLKSAPPGVTTMTLDLVTGDWVAPSSVEAERVLDVDAASDDEIVVGEEVLSASASAEGTPTRVEARAAARRASRDSAREWLDALLGATSTSALSTLARALGLPSSTPSVNPNEAITDRTRLRRRFRHLAKQPSSNALHIALLATNGTLRRDSSTWVPWTDAMIPAIRDALANEQRAARAHVAASSSSSATRAPTAAAAPSRPTPTTPAATPVRAAPTPMAASSSRTRVSTTAPSHSTQPSTRALAAALDQTNQTKRKLGLSSFSSSSSLSPTPQPSAKRARRTIAPASNAPAAPLVAPVAGRIVGEARAPKPSTVSPLTVAAAKPTSTSANALDPITTAWGPLPWTNINWRIQPFFSVVKVVAGTTLAGDQRDPIAIEAHFTDATRQLLGPDSRVMLLTTHLNAAFLSQYQVQDKPCGALVETRTIEWVEVDGGQRKTNPNFVGKLGALPDRSNPIDVTSLIDTKATRQTIRIKMQHECSIDDPVPACPFIVAVAVVKKAAVEDVVAVLEKRAVSVEARVAELRKDAEFADEDFVETSATVSLRDPLTCARITSPARCRTTKHVDCFDAATFLSANEASPSWRCPICTARLGTFPTLTVDAAPGMPAALRNHLDDADLAYLVGWNPLDAVVFDMHFAKMLKSAPVGADGMKLDMSTGEWSGLEKVVTDQVRSDAQPKSVPAAASNDDDDDEVQVTKDVPADRLPTPAPAASAILVNDDDEIECVEVRTSTPVPEPRRPRRRRRQLAALVVDLTMDSGEDEDPVREEEEEEEQVNEVEDKNEPMDDLYDLDDDRWR
ncbi:SUMO ligase siz1 [Allomyces arbusculus]|nr:SUMO ligase siz1 [Allomyces arbusculus]